LQLFCYSSEYFYWGNNKSVNRILKIIEKYNYDIVQIEYWYQGKIFEKLDSNIFKVIDTHDISSERKQKLLKDKHCKKLPYFAKRELNKYEKLERKFFNLADLLISISKSDYKALKAISPIKSFPFLPVNEINLDAVGVLPVALAKGK